MQWWVPKTHLALRGALFEENCEGVVHAITAAAAGGPTERGIEAREGRVETLLGPRDGAQRVYLRRRQVRRPQRLAAPETPEALVRRRRRHVRPPHHRHADHGAQAPAGGATAADRCCLSGRRRPPLVERVVVVKGPQGALAAAGTRGRRAEDHKVGGAHRDHGGEVAAGDVRSASARRLARQVSHVGLEHRHLEANNVLRKVEWLRTQKRGVGRRIQEALKQAGWRAGQVKILSHRALARVGVAGAVLHDGPQVQGAGGEREQALADVHVQRQRHRLRVGPRTAGSPGSAAAAATRQSLGSEAEAGPEARAVVGAWHEALPAACIPRREGLPAV